MEEKEKKIHPYKPTEEEREAMMRVSEVYIPMLFKRKDSYLEFSNMNLSDYINRGDRIFNALQEKISFQGRELSDLQSNIPRNKVSAINAKIALKLPRPVVDTWNDGVLSLGGTKMLQGLMDWTDENKKFRILNIQKGNELFTHGTVCTFTDFKNQGRWVKDIVKQGLNPIIKKRWALDKYGVYTRIVPLQEIYLSSFYIRDIQDQPQVVWKRTYDLGSFKMAFNEKTFYKNTNKVLPGMWYQDDYVDFSVESQEEDGNKIVVIKLFDKEDDRIITLANGVVIQDIPFPWWHKQYPLGWTQNDFFSNTDFAYGMSIPHKLSWDVEAIEFLVNSMFEQAKIAVNPPIVNYGMTEFEDDVLYAGRVLKSEGAPGDLQVLNIPGIDQSIFQLTGMFQSNADLASVDSLTQGVATGGKGITARRDVMAQQNIREVLGIPYTMLTDLQLQEANLQIANIVQFYPEKVLQTVTEGGEQITKEVYKTFRIFDVEIEGVNEKGELKGKKRGVREIDIQDREVSSKELSLREESAMVAGVNLEVLSPTPQAIRNLEYIVRIPDSDDYATSQDQKYAKLVNTLGIGYQFAPELMNKEQNIRELFKLSGQDPDEHMANNPQQQPVTRDSHGSLAPTDVERQIRQPEQVGLNQFGG